MAICVAIGTTLNNIFETIKGGEWTVSSFF